MPRRNRRRQPLSSRDVDPYEQVAAPTYEEMARSLVRRGLASPNILDRPSRPNTPQEVEAR